MNEILFVGRHDMTRAVARHAHESWEFVYCTEGSGAFLFDSGRLDYQQGSIVVIPPLLPHANASVQGFRNIHLNMRLPAFTLPEPTVVQDDSNHFALDAFNAALFYYQSARTEKALLLNAYGNLICCYLATFQRQRRRSPVVEDIEQDIIEHFSDCAYELDAYLKSLPFSYDYLRKLFQKEMLVTPHQYLINKRLQTAAEALLGGAAFGTSIADISRRCGFREPLYFSRLFKKKYGVSPSAYARVREKGDSLLPPDADSMKIFTPEDA